MSDNDVIAGHLYVVATPIGNLGDLSPRAQRVLAGVTRIGAEDTRNTASLLQHFGIRTPLLAVHDHNEGEVCAALVKALQAGESLALVSDAGTPLISDPGYALVRSARAAGVPVITIPGPCAAMAALSISGLATDSFLFIGFLPAKTQARISKLESLKSESRTLLFYESSHRITDSVTAIAEVLGKDRPLFLGRELTKRFEESIQAPAQDVVTWLAADSNRSRGEFVLIAAGNAEDTANAGDAERVLKLLLTELSPSRAVKLAAEITGVSKKILYEQALRLSDNAAQ